MSNLLIDESPLIVQRGLAVAFGINECIILQQVHFWTDHNRRHGKISHFKKDEWWCWNTIKEWQVEFPWLAIKKIERYLASLKKDGILISECLSGNKLDRTRWYRIDYKRLKAFIGASDKSEGCILPELKDDLYTEKTFRSSKLQLARSNPDTGTAQFPPHGGAAKSKLLQGDHAATVVAYPDKVPSAPDLTDKPNEYIQPFMGSRIFEFEQPCSEEGSVPLWEEFDQQDETIAQPETIDTTNQSLLVPKDRIKKEKKIAPRSRQKSQYALNRAYTYDASGWLQLPEANGLNSVARAIAVRAMQEILLTDHGESIDVFWEQDDEGNWLVLDSKHDCEAGSLDAMFGSKGRLPLGKLRDCCAGFSSVDQEEFNRDLQSLYEIALEYCEAGGALERLDHGERWIDQELFAEYLENWL
jgi:hypothetical protein